MKMRDEEQDEEQARKIGEKVVCAERKGEERREREGKKRKGQEKDLQDIPLYISHAFVLCLLLLVDWFLSFSLSHTH